MKRNAKMNLTKQVTTSSFTLICLAVLTFTQ